MIQVTNVSLNFGERVLLDSVTFSLKPGEKIGLVGRNGSGKSTLLKLLSKEMRPDGGQIDIPNTYNTGYLAQTITFDEDESPREVCNTAFSDVLNIERDLEDVQNKLESSTDAEEQMELAGKMSALIEKLQLVGADNMDEEVEKVLKGMGFRPNQFDEPVTSLSGGWKMRVELSRLLLMQPDLLLLDEPTNHLDIESIIWFEEYLQTYPGTVLVVSHDQHVLNNVTSRTLEVTPWQFYDLPHPYTKAMQVKQETVEVMMAAQKNQQRMIAQKERLIDKFKAKAGKAKFAKSLQSELKRMDIIDVDENVDKTMRLSFKEGVRVGRVVYDIQDLSKSYDEHEVIKGLDLKIERNERIAFVGQNGQGKTTLARILAGELKESGGEIIHGHNIQLGYYAQNQTDVLNGKKTILETIGQHAPGETIGRQRSILGSFLFEGDDVGKKVSVLSGGERARLSFACMVVHPTNVMIMDEPTNHLDIASKEILKNTLQQFEGTLIIVSHDMEFLDGLTTHTLEFKDGKITKHLFGIGEFLKKRKVESLRDLEHKAKSTVQAEDSPAVDKKPSNSDLNKLNKQLKALEQKIDRLEQRKKKLTHQMSSEGFYETNESSKVLEAYDQTLSELESHMSEWEVLAEKME